MKTYKFEKEDEKDFANNRHCPSTPSFEDHVVRDRTQIIYLVSTPISLQSAEVASSREGQYTENHKKVIKFVFTAIYMK